jgi:hypothetical protein
VSVEDEAKHILMKMGLWWPDADSGKLRDAADAWRVFAKAVDDARGPGKAWHEQQEFTRTTRPDTATPSASPRDQPAPSLDTHPIG